MSLDNQIYATLTFEKGQQVGTIEPATIIPVDDPLWISLHLMCRHNLENYRLTILQE